MKISTSDIASTRLQYEYVPLIFLVKDWNRTTLTVEDLKAVLEKAAKKMNSHLYALDKLSDTVEVTSI
uniref:Uncharacterized protein n=1 Tax=Glossina brevipalpis TaxID=37001 RepID=A0A1A9WNN1_9MUSC